jgi:hypothetical protein
MALALVENRWELNVQPGAFHLRHGNDEWDPFLAVHELMAGKLSSRAWIRQCQDLGISEMALTADDRNPSAQTDGPSPQPSLFDSGSDC